MSSLSVTNTFVDGQVITASGHNQNNSDIVNYINNRNSGSSTWDAVSVSTNSGVPLTANNSTGTSDIVRLQDNGTTVFSVADGGVATIYTPNTGGTMNLVTDQSGGPTIVFKEVATTRWILGHDGGLDTDSFVIRDSTNSINSFVMNNGILTFVSQSAARAYRTTSTQVITSGNTTKVQFNAESYDVKSEFDSATNYRFTATRAGKYLITAKVNLTAAGIGTGSVYIYQNGSSINDSSGILTTGATTFDVLISDVVNMAASDYIEIFVSASANNMTINLGTNKSYVAISKIA
jgi:hypothetical protein